MEEIDRKVIECLAKNDMNITATGNELFMHRNTAVYHLEKVKRETGLDPRKFYDLVKLLNTPL